MLARGLRMSDQGIAEALADRVSRLFGSSGPRRSGWSAVGGHEAGDLEIVDVSSHGLLLVIRVDDDGDDDDGDDDDGRKRQQTRGYADWLSS